MLTKIVSPETMPKNNRKMAKGQRFIMRDWAWGIGYGALGMGEAVAPLGETPSGATAVIGHCYSSPTPLPLISLIQSP
jgi:hypothetical protein